MKGILQACKQHYLCPDVMKTDSPNHILSLFKLQLESAVPGATEVSPAVPGLDGGVGQVSGVLMGPSRLPAPNRVNTSVIMMRRMTIRARLLLPFTSQGLGDGAAPHEVVTGPVNILIEKYMHENANGKYKKSTFLLKKNMPALSKAQ